MDQKGNRKRNTTQKRANPRPPRQRRGQQKKKNQKSLYASTTDVTEILVPTQQPSITITVPILQAQIYGVCASYVSTALSRGWLARSPSASYPYWAAAYMYTLLVSYISASVPKVPVLPQWLQNYGQALTPKNVRCQEGKASYAFDVSALGMSVPSAAYNLAVNAYGYEYLLYDEGSGQVNLFPVATAPAGYNEGNGFAAWSSLSLFMTYMNNPGSQIVALRTTTWMKNVSAFAMPINAEGAGAGDAGGQVYQAALEVPIHTPSLSVFANVLLAGAVNPTRYGMFTNTFAGDSCFSSYLFYFPSHTDCVSTKKPPRFHAIDFIEFADVVAQWVVKLLATALGTASYQPTSLLSYVCPITIQEMQLILRNELMSVFGNTQNAVQTLYPRAPATSSTNEFVPFLCSSNTVALSSTGMKIPMLIAENVKALRGRWIESKGMQSSFFCPVLGKYYNDVLISGDYRVQDRDGNFAEVFRGPTSVVKVGKSPSDRKVQLEQPIDFVDGSSGSNYVFINDQDRLRALTALWNTWLDPLSSFSMTLTNFSADQGINICTAIGQTCHWIPRSVANTELHRQFVDERMEQAGMLVGVYADRMIIAISSHDRLYSPVYSMLTSNWVLPVNKAVAGTGTADQSLFQRQQIMMGETFSVSLASEDGGTSMSVRHITYASLMVRGITAPKSEIETFFTEQAKAGHGGILSGLVSGWLGKTFGPAVGSLANTVAEILPL